MPPKKKAEPAAEAALSLVEKVRKKFGADTAVIPATELEEVRSSVRGVIPCGIDVVDHFIFALGGAPRGRWTELFSDEGGCKTTFGWTHMGACQRAGGLAIYCDSEKSYDVDRAALFGVDNKALVLLQPETMEEAMEEMHFALTNAVIDVPIILVWDSVASETFEGESGKKLEGNFHKSKQDTRARLVGEFTRKMKGLAIERQAHMLCINQTRQMRGVMFGPATTTPAGKALKFIASHRIQLWSGQALKNSLKRHVGKTITFQIVKSRFSEPMRKAKVRIDYTHGWDNTWSTINHAKDLELIDKGAKVTEATYADAVAKLGWKNAAPYREIGSSGAEEDYGDEEGDGLD